MSGSAGPGLRWGLVGASDIAAQSIVPAVRALFAARFGADRIAGGGELTSIASGLALIAAEDDPSPWTVPDA